MTSKYLLSEVLAPWQEFTLFNENNFNAILFNKISMSWKYCIILLLSYLMLFCSTELVILNVSIWKSLNMDCLQAFAKLWYRAYVYIKGNDGSKIPTGKLKTLICNAKGNLYYSYCANL